MFTTLLPPEVLLKIASHLSEADYISFANTNKKLLHILSSFSKKSILNLSNGYVLNCSSLNTFLSAKSPTMVTKLDLGNCYWFDPSLLVKLITGLSSSLTSLHIQGTQLCSSQIAEILTDCTQIVELSVSFSKKDKTFWLPKGSYEISGDFVKDTIKSSVFHGLESNLNRLTWLSLHGSETCFRQFLVFLWFCNKSLESINLEFFKLPQDDYDGYEDFTKDLFQLSPQLPIFRSVKRVTSSKSHSNGSGFTTSTILKNLALKDILDDRQPADGADYEDDYYPTESERIMEVIWFPQNDAIALYRYLKDEGTGLLMTDEEWSDEDLFSKFTGLTSLCLLGNPNEYNLGTEFFKEAENKLTNLKLLCSPYDSKHFEEFAKNHDGLKVLQLSEPASRNRKPIPAGHELAEGLIHLINLEKFSIDSRCFKTFDQNDASLSLAVNQLTKSCASTLNEIEIGIFTIWPSARPDRKGHVCQISSYALEAISNCPNLERLSLANLEVDSNNSFLHSILAGCHRLKSLRFSNVHHPNSVPILLVDQLKTGLPLAENLHDFRWEVCETRHGFKKPFNAIGNIWGDIAAPTTYEVNLAEFLEALKLCQYLQRFVFIGDHTVRLDVTGTGAVDWPSLVLACIVSPTVDWETCELEIKSNRSAFQSYFGSNKTEVADSADACHYLDMILFDSNVAKFPY